MNPIHDNSPQLFATHYNIIILCCRLPSGLSYTFPHKASVVIFSHIRATCTAHLPITALTRFVTSVRHELVSCLGGPCAILGLAKRFRKLQIIGPCQRIAAHWLIQQTACCVERTAQCLYGSLCCSLSQCAVYVRQSVLLLITVPSVCMAVYAALDHSAQCLYGSLCCS